MLRRCYGLRLVNLDVDGFLEVFLHRSLAEVLHFLKMPALGFRQAGDAIGQKHRVFAGRALLGVILQRSQRPLAQKQNGNQVHDAMSP